MDYLEVQELWSKKRYPNLSRQNAALLLGRYILNTKKNGRGRID